MAKQIPDEKIANVSVPLTCVRVLMNPHLRITALRCVASIFRNFFLLQYKHSFLSGRVPVTKVDHALDSKIPFMPDKVNIYLDFVAFWVRTVGYLMKHCNHRALEPVRNFLQTMGELYTWAAEVYRKNLSTTERPFYIKKPRFLLIHMVDPHLMCIPSLHVMIVIRTYTLFGEILKTLGEEERFTSQFEELRLGALAITEAVLYVKQHSVNCISAAMYAATRFNPSLFPPDEAEHFASNIFAQQSNCGVNEENGRGIREHILSLYHRFLTEGEAARDWTEPLLGFLKELSQ